jgi:hypothetical protein
MEVRTPPSLCPMCSRALKISTIEPHPTREGMDIVTYRCLIHGDISRSVVNRDELAGTELAMLPPYECLG